MFRFVVEKIDMAHSKSIVWIHAVWSTKHRQDIIHPEIEKEIFEVMKSTFAKMGCIVGYIDGFTDHVHCLFSLGRDQTISDVIGRVKGASSFYINKNKLTDFRFEWQEGFAAYSVSPSDFDRVFNYIKYQKMHHKIGNIIREHEND